MKKVFKWMGWVLLSILILVLIILVPIGINKGYENLRASSLTEQEKYLEDLERFEYIMKNEFSGYGVLQGSKSFDIIFNQLKTGVKQGKIDSQKDFNLSIIKAVASFKDPHTSVYNDNVFLDSRFPYYLDWSNGSLYLLSGTVDKKWLGAEVIKIGNTSSEDVYAKLSAYANAPNEAGTAFFIRSFLYSADVLFKEGIIESPEKVDLEVRLDNEVTTLGFNSMSRAAFAVLSDYYRIAENFNKDELPLFMRNKNQNYWYEYLQDKDLFYLRYSMCVAQSDIESFWNEVFDKLVETKPDKFVIDVRGNPGGDTQNHGSFLHRLRKDTLINKYGKLFTLIDRGTGSAAVSFASNIEKMTEAILVGEKTMDKPNTTSDPTFFTLPHSEITILVPSLYSLHALANDSRDAVNPDIPIVQKLDGINYVRDEVMDSIANLQFDDLGFNYAELPSNLKRQYAFSPIRNASLSLRDSVWYFSIDGAIDAPIYQNDSTIFTKKYNITFTQIDSLGEHLNLRFHGKEIQLNRVDVNNISLEKSINDRNFGVTEDLLASMKANGELPYFLDRPYFQKRVYRLYNEHGFDDALALNQLTKKIYPDDPVVSIIDFELYQYEGNILGQAKAIFPIVGKLLNRYYTVITTDKVINDDYNAFIGK